MPTKPYLLCVTDKKISESDTPSQMNHQFNFNFGGNEFNSKKQDESSFLGFSDKFVFAILPIPSRTNGSVAMK